MAAIKLMFHKQTFQKLSTFKSIDDLYKAVRKHIDHNRDFLTKNDVRILNHIKGYSKKNKGVSYLTKEHIAEDLQISHRTVVRRCNNLEDLGIIKQVPLKRPSDHRQTSNAIVIQPFSPKSSDENSEIVTPVSHQKEDLFKNNKKHIKTTTQEIDHTYLPNYIDESFIRNAKPFFNADRIHALWLKVIIAHKKSNVSRPVQEVIEPINKALKQTIFLNKNKRITTSFDGYFYRLCENYLAVEKRKEADVDLVTYNWLEA